MSSQREVPAAHARVRAVLHTFIITDTAVISARVGWALPPR